MDDNEKPLTFSRFVAFFYEVIEPRFQKIEGRLDGFEIRFDRMDGQFDDLYKKFETLYQEYVVSNEQIRRLTSTFVTKAEFEEHLRTLH